MTDNLPTVDDRPGDQPEVSQPRARTDGPTGWRYHLTLRTVAEHLFHQALARGEGAVDIGLLGPSVYLDDAAHTLWSIAVGDERVER